MTTYTIYQDATGVTLWEGEAASEADAFEACAREAGYDSHADLIAQTGEDDGVKITDRDWRKCE